MKSISFKTGVSVFLVVLLAQTIAAQRPGNKRTQPANQQNKDSVTPTVFGGIPIIIDASVMIDTVKKSVKQPGTFGAGATRNRIPLPYENLRYDDALYVQKVWRELDLREKMNEVFRYDATNDNGSQLFMNMLLNTVKAGEVPAFEDDRFSVPVSAIGLTDQVQGKLDTFPRYKLDGTIDAYIVMRAKFDPKTVSKIRIMEEWIFDREGSRMHCRILGIAPLKTHYLPDGKEKESSSVMFWVSYPDLRPMLANAEVYNPKNMGQSRMTWEELFESHMFSSYIIKSTLSNAANKTIRSGIKDPVLALVEGDNIRNKLFNYEQDLWSY